MARTILITGCSTGLGYAAAQAFTARGYRVIATVRNEADAERLRAALPGDLHVTLCDVTDKAQVDALPAFVKSVADGGWLDGLINNAGHMLAPGPVEHQRLDDIRAQFDVNVFGMIAVTIALLPLLGTADPSRRHAGRILNISSIEGKVASPFISGYAATKHAIEGFTASLRRELRLFGIKAIIVAPGGIKSEMWRKNSFPVEPLLDTPYEAPFRKLNAMLETMEKDSASAEEVAKFLVRVFEAPRPKARYPYAKALLDSGWTTLIPDLWYDQMLGIMFGLRRERAGSH